MGAEEIVRRLFLTREGRANPFPHYRRLRDAAPLHFSPLAGGWVLTRYDDVWGALREPRFNDLCEEPSAGRAPLPKLLNGESLLSRASSDEEQRLKRIVSRLFTWRTVEMLRPQIETTVDDLLDSLEDAGGGDLIGAVAAPLPVAIAGQFLGIPAVDRPRFVELAGDVAGATEGRSAEELQRISNAAQMYARGYFLELLCDRRRSPKADLWSELSRTTRSDDGADRPTDDEVATFGIRVLVAARETATNLIGNAVLALLRHPNQLALLRANGSLFTKVTDELLRYAGPVQVAVRRADDVVDIRGVRIASGDRVLAVIGAANRDPERFVNPERLDVTRSEVYPLSEEGGVASRLVGSLARVEVELVLRALVDRFDTIELVGEAPRQLDRVTSRGLVALRLAVRGGVRRAQRGSRVAQRSAAAPARRLAWLQGEKSRDEAAARPASSRRTKSIGRHGSALPTVSDVQGAPTMHGTAKKSPPARTARGVAATAAVLARTALFRKCSADELREIATGAHPMSFEPGDVLCLEGADSPEAYAIAEGEALVTIGGARVATVGEDDVVGERGPLEGRVRSATVTATTHMVTYAISRQRLLALVARSPVAATAMYETIRSRYTN